MTTVYLGLGSNLGDREWLLTEAIRRLEAEGLQIVRRSTITETPPAYVLNQPDFLNMVIEVRTELFPLALLRLTQKVEKDMGRARRIAKGPRNIDIDILIFGNLTLQTPNLKIPHPFMHERPFVLVPLAELGIVPPHGVR